MLHVYHAVQALFKRITSLSYLGDVRMGLAEDSRKVERIVTGSYSHFMDTYLPVLQVRLVSLRAAVDLVPSCSQCRVEQHLCDGHEGIGSWCAALHCMSAARPTGLYAAVAAGQVL
jgi:hypothetical protein